MKNDEAIALLSEWAEKRLFYSLEHKRSIIKAVYLAIEALKNERPKGKWIDEPIKGVRYHCSLCYGRHDYKWPYCPSCGADMREADNDKTD